MRTAATRLLVAASVAATGLVVGAPASQAAVTNDTVVPAWYREFLGRSPEQARSDEGRRSWVGQLDAGASRGDVLWAITHSREHVEREVAAAYDDHLHRAPDRGASSWVDNAVDHGMSLEWVEQNVLASPEYYAASGIDDGPASTEFAVEWEYFHPVLGRCEASPGEVAYWSNRFRQVGRLQTVRELWYTDEAVRHRIDEHYSDLLLRNADVAGLAYWYPLMVANDLDVQVLIAATPEFATAHEYV